MARIRMSQHRMTFKEGCEMYLLDCRQRNLREGTIRHYRQSFQRFSRYFDDDISRRLKESWINGVEILSGV